MSTTIRRLGADAATVFRDLRLEALSCHPAAFAASYEAEALQPIEGVQERLQRSAVFGGFFAGELVGSAGFARPEPRKKCHKGILFGVYVRAEARGHGLGRALVSAVIEHARARVVQLHTTVTTANPAAAHLYRALGFTPYGLEPRGLQVDGRYYDQELLVLLLDGADARSRPGA